MRNVLKIYFHIFPITLLRDENIDSGKTDLPNTNTFVSTNRHCDVMAYDLSERWGISLKAAINTLKKTTQRFLRSAVLLLSRRYCTDMMFERKTHILCNQTFHNKSNPFFANRLMQYQKHVENLVFENL